MDRTPEFELERGRLTRIAGSILGDRAEAEDVVQQAWLRLERSDSAAIANLQGWLTTVVTRLCLDRLKAAVPVPVEPSPVERAPGRTGLAGPAGSAVAAPGDPAYADPAHEVALADSVGSAMQVVLDRLSPTERVAFVLHDSFSVDFATIAAILDSTPAAARKLASRARARVAQPGPEAGAGASESPVNWVVVDAFLLAAREGEFSRLLELLAPDVVVVGDPVAVGIGTPERISGREAVAGFFNGAAASALPVFADDRPGAAWFDRGTARVVFDFQIVDGRVTRIDFRADPAVLATVRRRRDGDPQDSARKSSPNPVT